MRLTNRKDYVKALMSYHKEYYTDGGFPTIFSLQQKMLEMGICPRCGTKSRCFSSTGHFPCRGCGFKITESELYKVLDENKPNPKLLERKLNQKTRKESKK